ncbi:MAG: delta-60 repeat domain-containing protein, partial [Mycobacteriales bacterium]
VAVGRTNALGILKTAFGVVGYTPDGKLNPNFGNGGIVTTPFAGMGAQAKAVVVQQDGKFVVAGSAFTSAIDEDFAVARYNANGSLDDNFGAHGLVTIDLGSDNDFATGLAIESDGKIVVGGNSGEDVGLARLQPNGSLDITFGNLGKSVTKIGLGADVNGLALTSDGGIRIAGSTVGALSQNHDFLLAGFKADGTLNLGFGHFGVVTTDFGQGDDFAENLLVDSQGEIVLVGRATSDTIIDLALAAYQPDGSPADFGRGGVFTVDFHGLGDFGQDLVIDSKNRVIAAGGTGSSNGTEFALTRVFR